MLTEKQSRFVDEYLIDFNATRSYKAAYPNCKSDNTARTESCKFLAKPNIQEEVMKRKARLKEKVQITQEMVINEYKKIAFFDPRKLFNDDGTARDISQLDDDTAAALAGLDVSENWEFDEDEGKRVKNGYTKKYKISDKKGALDSLARHLGMFTDKIQIEGELNVTSPADEINSRIAGIAERIEPEKGS